VSRSFVTVGDLTAALGEHMGHSDWLDIDQSRIDRFADATGDHQWIHVDAARAASGPYGRTIAHGYLSLSLVPVLVSQVIDYSGWATKVNYGSDKVRFPAPVPVGSRIRAGVELLAVREIPAGIQVTNRVTIEIEGSERPAVVADTITLLIP
jgi:acyl dehydratase